MGQNLKEGLFIEIMRDPILADYFEVFGQINIFVVEGSYKGILNVNIPIGKIRY